jgi:F-type H+-transporting ATPase subunit delta
MPTDRVAQRKASVIYAETLLAAAQSAGTVFEVSGQLVELLRVINANIELREALADSALPATGRREITQEVLSDFDPALKAVIGVVIERNDLGLLHKINEAYIDAAEQALAAVIIDVTTAVELDDDLRNAIRTKFSAQFASDVLLREHLNPAIIGGIILSAHGKRIDASVVSQLEQARITLSKSR